MSNSVEDIFVDAEDEVKRLQDLLNTERRERQELEQEASKVIRQFKRKYEDAMKKKNADVQSLQESVEVEHKRNEQLESANEDITRQLRKLKEQLEKAHGDSKRESIIQAPAKRPSTSAATGSPAKAPGSAVQARQIEELKEQLENLNEEFKAKEFEVERVKERQKFSTEMNFQYREEIHILKKEKRELEDELRKTREAIEEQFHDKIQALVEEISELEEEKKQMKSEIEDLSETQEFLKAKIAKKDDTIDKMTDKISELKDLNEKYRKEKNAQNEKEKKDLLQQLRDMRYKLDNESQKFKDNEKKFAELRAFCDQHDKASKEIQEVLDKKTVEYNRLLKEKMDAEKERDTFKDDLAQANRCLSGEKARSDEFIKSLNEKIKGIEHLLTLEKEKSRKLHSELEQEKKKSDSVARRMIAVQKELEKCVKEANSAEERATSLEEEIREIKEECAQHISEILSQKSRCSRFRADLNDANEEIENLEARIESLVSEMKKMKADSDTDIFRLNERIRQHHDLENVMLKKIEMLESKKKPLIGISPRPHPKTPQSNGFMRNVREFEAELAKERETNRKLQEELIRVESELMDFKMEARMKDLRPKPDVEDSTTDDEDTDTGPSAPPPPYLKYSIEAHANTSFTESTANSAVSSDDNDAAPSDDDNDGNTTISESHCHRPTIAVDVHHDACSIGSSRAMKEESHSRWGWSESASKYAFNSYQRKDDSSRKETGESHSTPSKSRQRHARTSPFKFH